MHLKILDKEQLYSMETVGFIGLGNMGGGMSANIQKAGYSMVVYDLREEAARPLLEGGGAPR